MLLLKHHCPGLLSRSSNSICMRGHFVWDSLLLLCRGDVSGLLLCCHLLAGLLPSLSGEVRKFPEKHISPLPYLLLPHISNRAGEGSGKEHSVYFAQTSTQNKKFP